MTDAIAGKHRGESKNFAHFPFAKDAAHWPDRINGLKHDLPVGVRTLFGLFQPYKGGNDTLWALNYIANLKNHKILIPVGFGLGAILRFPDWTPPPDAFLTIGPEVYRKDEIIMFALGDTDPVPQVHLSPVVVIDNPEKIINGKQPVPLLNQMSIWVKSIVSDTETLCQNLGITDQA
jgi:hypothetical protein